MTQPPAPRPRGLHRYPHSLADASRAGTTAYRLFTAQTSGPMVATATYHLTPAEADTWAEDVAELLDAGAGHVWVRDEDEDRLVLPVAGISSAGIYAVDTSGRPASLADPGEDVTADHLAQMYAAMKPFIDRVEGDDTDKGE